MIELTTAQTRDYLLGQLHLRQPVGTGASGVRRLLQDLRCIQLDPLDRIGTNADLVALARVEDLHRGDVYRHLLPGHAFEHFAKERCLLPVSAFPWYRAQAQETPWWRLGERVERLPAQVLDAVLAEVAAKGPVTAPELTDHGAVEALDWAGWKGTGKATSMALEVLWTRCQIVVTERRGPAKAYDMPERALGPLPAQNAEGFARWALLERVEAAGLLSLNAGPHWSMLAAVRTSDLPQQLVAQGLLEEVTVAGNPRRYLAPAGFRDRKFPKDDGQMRILGPLDPLLWDRKLVAHAFGFDYVWEVYKPAEKRVFGYYVCPLLHRGALVGRLEAHREGQRLVVDQLWREPGQPFDDAALHEALARHERAQAPAT